MLKLLIQIISLLLIVSLVSCQSGIAQVQKPLKQSLGEMHNRLAEYVMKSPNYMAFMSKDVDTLFTIDAYEAYMSASKEFLMDNGVTASEADEYLAQTDSLLFMIGALKIDNSEVVVENFDTDYLDAVYDYVKNYVPLEIIEESYINTIYDDYRLGKSYSDISDRIDQIPIDNYPQNQINKLLDFISVFQSSAQYWPAMEPEILGLPGGIGVLLWDCAGGIIGGCVHWIVGLLMATLFSMIAFQKYK
ncbi:MAG: hypothetical protein WCQ59_08540 [Candidatus Cloacimonadaceae bacterium]